MDPPDVLDPDLSGARPTQLPGRAKSEFLIHYLWVQTLHLAPVIQTHLAFRSWAKSQSWNSVCAFKLTLHSEKITLVFLN